MTNRLEIINYFDSLINDVDLIAEELLNLTLDSKTYRDDISVETMINDKRTLLIDKIQDVKTYNLNHLDENEQDLSENKTNLFKNYCLLINRYDWRDSLRQTNANIDIFKKAIHEAFCFLVVLDEFVDDNKLTLFKELILTELNQNNQTLQGNIFKQPFASLNKV